MYSPGVCIFAVNMMIAKDSTITASLGRHGRLRFQLELSSEADVEGVADSLQGRWEEVKGCHDDDTDFEAAAEDGQFLNSLCFDRLFDAVGPSVEFDHLDVVQSFGGEAHPLILELHIRRLQSRRLPRQLGNPSVLSRNVYACLARVDAYDRRLGW